MESGIWIFILIFIPPFQTTAEKEYTYVEKEMTWSDALDFCEQNNSVLSALSNDDIASIEKCNQSSKELWTSSYLHATPYLSIIGCFRNTARLNFSSFMKPSILDCQDMCSNSSAIAIMNTNCACLDDNLSFLDTEDANACNITCEGTFFCGGKDSMNVYSVVGEDFFSLRQHETSPDFTSCISYQCVPGTNEYLYKDVDCSSEEVKEAACSTFFSCTFETADPCFLSQVKNDSLDWSISVSEIKHAVPHKAYQGSNFAFVNDNSNDYKPGDRVTLRSNINFPYFKDGDWCLRFWVFQNISAGGYFHVYVKNSGLNETLELYNETFSAGQYTEWKYSEIDFLLQKNSIIFFEFVRGKTQSIIAIDDITLTKRKCENTFSKVLLMSGEIKCDFEGNKDICFIQSKDDNFDWMTTRNGRTRSNGQNTGPKNNTEGNYFSFINTCLKNSQDNQKGVLISKFNVTDVNITFSMQYNMNGRDINTLKVYLKNEKDEIFNRTGDQGDDWKIFNFTTYIEGTSRIQLSASRKEGKLGDIAIDDIRVKINRADIKSNWMNQNEMCKDNLGSYTINHQQLSNLPCLAFDSERWTGILRPHIRGTATKELKKHPNKVKVYKNLSVNYKYVWVPFNLTSIRPFVCERRSNLSTSKEICLVLKEVESISIHYPKTTTSSSDTLVGVLVACALVIFLGIIIFLIYYKRKKATKYKKQRNSKVTAENVVYMNDNERILIQSKNSAENKEVEENNSKIKKKPEEDYDHLHQVNNSMTSKTDDLYSHMTGSQYESQKMIVDDTYAHTVEIENEYGAPKLSCHDDNETYDHAHALEINPDGEYNLLHQVNRNNETLYNHV